MARFSGPAVQFGTSRRLQYHLLHADDIEAIKACEIGRCGVKLSREMIARLRRGIRAGDPAELFRQVLLDYLQSYLAAGNNALLKYDERLEAHSAASSAVFFDARYWTASRPI